MNKIEFNYKCFNANYELDTSHRVNLIISNPGLGKSTLLKVLNINLDNSLYIKGKDLTVKYLNNLGLNNPQKSLNCLIVNKVLSYFIKDYKNLSYYPTHNDYGLLYNNRTIILFKSLNASTLKILRIVIAILYKQLYYNIDNFPVLIDNIDNKLHPLIQKDIVFKLITYFNKVQFFISTNSPIILGSVKANMIYIDIDKSTNNRLIENIPTPYGKSIDCILSEYMCVSNIYPDEVQNLINECGTNIENRNYDDAIIKLKELENIVGRYHKEYVSLSNLLKFLGIKINKNRII